ncbi:Putative major facilitator superfamily, MFS transporter superfamily [Septoria linicola]|uniref:Major facilitator superfamily, MFS transporter superfamily n=1 Tax=Septoria linicola TaxID=215465 RepID=A0A9Q9EGE0_9PEZI|nr:Putative major facilitator superfamily, MFS transporter superfamily [Septoria linicola]
MSASKLSHDEEKSDENPRVMTPSATTSSDGEQHKSEGEGRQATNYDGAVQEPQPRSDAVPPPPNGGYGWVCTACCATINAHTWGLNSSYGVFLAHYLATNTFPGGTYLQYAFVGSLSISMAMLISPAATLSTRFFGTKVTLFIGVFLETLSLIGASFAYQIWHLFLSQGICFGLGMGFLFVGSVGIPAQWFTTKRSLSNGISAAGSGFGGLIYSLATGAMLKSIGLAWTFRVLGILAFGVNTICVLLLKDRNKIIGSTHNAFDIQLFKRTEYLLLGGFGWFSMLGYVVLIFSLANYANAIGLNAQQASVVSAILNLGQGLGRPPIGYFSDTIGRINMAFMMTALCAIFNFAIWIPAQSYGVLILFALVGGMVAGTYWTAVSPVTAEVVGLRHVPSALNLSWLVIVLPTAFSEPIALEIVEGTGKYIGAQVFVGFMYLAAAVCVLFLRGWKIGEVAEVARRKGESSSDVDTVAIESDEDVAAYARVVARIMSDFWKWAKV